MPKEKPAAEGLDGEGRQGGLASRRSCVQDSGFAGVGKRVAFTSSPHDEGGGKAGTMRGIYHCNGMVKQNNLDNIPVSGIFISCNTPSCSPETPRNKGASYRPTYWMPWRC